MEHLYKELPTTNTNVEANVEQLKSIFRTLLDEDNYAAQELFRKFAARGVYKQIPKEYPDNPWMLIAQPMNTFPRVGTLETRVDLCAKLIRAHMFPQLKEFLQSDIPELAQGVFHTWRIIRNFREWNACNARLRKVHRFELKQIMKRDKDFMQGWPEYAGTDSYYWNLVIPPIEEISDLGTVFLKAIAQAHHHQSVEGEHKIRIRDKLYTVTVKEENRQ